MLDHVPVDPASSPSQTRGIAGLLPREHIQFTLTLCSEIGFLGGGGLVVLCLFVPKRMWVLGSF